PRPIYFRRSRSLWMGANYSKQVHSPLQPPDPISHGHGEADYQSCLFPFTLYRIDAGFHSPRVSKLGIPKGCRDGGNGTAAETAGDVMIISTTPLRTSFERRGTDLPSF